jgi:hypothetical protein
MTAFVGRIAHTQGLSQQNNIYVDGSGNIYLTGQESGITNASYIAKFDNGGVFQWDKVIGDNAVTEAEEGGYVAVDTSGNSYIAYNAPVSGTAGFALVKLDSSGTHQWSRTISLSGVARTYVYGIAIDSSSNIYVTGVIANEGFLLKYDNSGTFQWHRRIQSQASSQPQARSYDIYYDGSDIYLAGGNNSYNGSGSNTNLDQHCVKYSTSGTLTTLGSLKYDTSRTQEIIGQKISVDSSGNIFVLDKDRDLIVKYNSSGTLQWNKTIGGATIVVADIECQGTDLYIVANDNTDTLIFKINSSDALVYQRKLEHSTENVIGANITTDANYLYVSGVIETSDNDLFFARLALDGTIPTLGGNFSLTSVSTYSLSNAGFTSGDVPKNANSTDPSATTTAKTVANVTYTISVYGNPLGSANFSLTATLSSSQNPTPSMVYLGNEHYTWDQTDTWANFSIVDSWRIEERLDSQIILTASGIKAKIGSANLTSQFNLISNSNVVKIAAANFTTVSEILITARRLPQGQSSLNSTATLNLTGIVDIKANAGLSSTFDLNVNAQRVKLADIVIDDFAALSIQAEVTNNAKANLSSAFTITPRGGFLVTIDDPYDYTWNTIDPDTWEGFVKDQWGPEGWFAFDAITLLARGGSERNADANLFVETTLTAIGEKLPTGSSSLTVATELSVIGQRLPGGSSNLSSEFNLNVTAEKFDIAIAGIASEFNLQAKGGIIHEASAVIEDALNFNITAERIRTVQSNLSVTTTLICAPSLIPSVIIDDLIVTASVSINANRFVGGRAGFEAFAATLTAGERLPGGSASLTSAFIVSAFGGSVFNGRAGLEAFVANLTDARLSDVRGNAALHSQFNGEFAGDLRLLDSEFIYTILSDTRRYRIDTETRSLDILADTRKVNVQSETRGLDILPENRTIDVSKSLVD